jgi:type II secretory pathway predicted ATPase ExeA
MKDPTARVDDAFRLTPDPAAYFPRAAFEAALAELMEQIAAGPTCAALIGDPGLGKTLLLHVLKERLEGAFECLYVPFPRLDPAELWSWVAAALGRAGSEDPRAAVVEHARRRGAEGVGLVLLVDDAGALPRETRRALILASRSGVFSLVLAFNSEDHATLDELPEAVRRIDLGPPLTLAETRAYVRARLRRADPDGAIAARLGPEQMAELHEASAGVPALLHAMLDAWLRGSAEPRSQPPQARPAPTLAEEPAEAPPPQRAAHPPPRPAPANAPRRDFFRQRGTSRVPLVLAVLLVLGAAGFWRFATQRETAAPPPPERAQPERAEAAPAAPAEVEPVEPLAALEPSEAATAEAPEVSEPLDPPPPPSDPTPAPPAEAVPAQSPGSVPEPEPAPAAAIAPADEPPAAPAPPGPQLAPPPSGPRLNVNAAPWAEIQLDGRPVGETPIGELPVAPGPHRVSATLPDGRVLEREIDARAGDVYLVFE